MRIIIPDLELDWITAGPAGMILREAGENLVPEASQWIDYASAVADTYKTMPPYRVNIAEYAIEIQKYKELNVATFKQFINNQNYDLVIGDETFEIVYALRTGQIQMKPSGLDSLLRESSNATSSILSETTLDLSLSLAYLRNWLYRFRYQRRPSYSH